MEFLVLFVPFGLPVLITGIDSLCADRNLLLMLRSRYPHVLDVARGRPLRWYDGPDELEFGQASYRRRLFAVLAPALHANDELAAVVVRSERTHKHVRRAAWIGGSISVLLLVAIRIAVA